MLGAALLGATPLLHVSVERTGSELVAHLSIRDVEDVELSLYELPAEPAELFAEEGPRRAQAFPPARSPAPIADLQSGRRALLESAAALEAGLSKGATRLLKAWSGLDAPVARALPRLPRAEVETRGELIRAWRVDAPEPGWNYSEVELNPLPPGLYSLVMRAEGARAQATVVVGDLTALCLRTPVSVTFLAQERETGIPRSGAEIYVERQGQPVLIGRTAADGVFTTRVPVPDSVVVRQGKELAILSLPDVVHAGDPDTIGAVLLDRAVARPGEAVGVWGLFRSIGALDGRLSLPDSSHAELQLMDREGRTILRQPLTLSALGTATTELELPPGLAAGDYSVAMAVGDQRRAADLTLAESGSPQLSLACESIALDAEPAVRCTAGDALGRPEPGVAVHWRLEHPLEGPTEEGAAGASVTEDGGQIDIPVTPIPGGQRLHAEAVDALGRVAAASLALPDSNPIHLAFRSERRLLRPGRSATLTLEATAAGESFRGRVRLTAISVRTGPSGESQATPLFERWLETDARGHASLSLTASSAGYIELSAVTQPPGGSAHATLFVSENGGDIPATPERLTLIAEAGEHHRGEETRLLVLAPFEAGTVLLSFEPPITPTQAVAVRGYSGVARLTLPPGAGALTAVATALRGGRVITDRLSLLPPRVLPLVVRAALDHPTHPGARPAISLDPAYEAGHPLASQVTLLLGEGEGPPALAELLARAHSRAVIAAARSTMDSVPEAASLEPQTTVPFGPARVEAEVSPQGGSLQSVSSPETGRLVFAPAGLVGGATLTLVAAAGPEEIGETRLKLPAGTTPVPVASPHSLGLVFMREGDQPLERRGVRVWQAPPPEKRPLAQAINDLLSAVPITGASADLGCAAVRALASLSPGKAMTRGPLARLAQLENLEGGFGEASAEMRRDLAALRGLRALGAMSEPELERRTRSRVGSLADDMQADDPERAAALALVSSSSAPEPSARLTPDELRSASAQQLALWLAAHSPTRSQQQLAGARVRQLIGSADVLDLADLAVAAGKLGFFLTASSNAPNVARQLFRLQPAIWTQALLDADEEPTDPARVALKGPVRVGEEIEVQLTAPVAGRGNYCMRDFPPAGGIPEGASSAEATVVLCGEPSGGILQLAYRVRMAAPGRFQMPAPAFGVERPTEGSSPEWIEIIP